MRISSYPKVSSVVTAVLAAFTITTIAARNMLSSGGLSGLVAMGAPEGLRVGSAMTMEAWIHPKGKAFRSSTDGVIMGKEGEYLLARFHDGTIRFAVANGTPGWKWVSTGVVVPDAEWTHVALTYEGDSIDLYINGVRSNSIAGSGVISDVDAEDNDFWLLGRGDIDQRFAGWVDDARVWNLAREPHEIRGAMHRLLEGNEPGLIGYWPMDENSGNTISDQTSNGHDGALQSGVSRRESTAPIGVPIADVGRAEAIHSTGATVHGEVKNGDSETEAYFEWGRVLRHCP